MGLTPSEINQVLPRNLMFLKDDDLLIDNYHALCNYGVPRSMIGKIYMEARDVFSYDHGVLYSKLLAYEDLGLNHNSVVKVIMSNPSFLIGSVNGDFVKLLDLLKSSEIDFKWIEERLSYKNSYNWSRMLQFLSFISEIACSKENLKNLMRRHPQLLVEDSGRTAINLVGILLKMGSTGKEISSFLLQFPRVQIGTFVKNLRQGLLFLIEIEMDANDINKIVCEHPLLLGFCSLKKPTSILSMLKVGKKRLCNHIKEDPNRLKKWAMGSKVEPLPNSGDNQKSFMQKTEFLLNVGFIENSDKFNKALKVFRGKGGELQERFDCFVEAGLDRKDVTEIIKVAPQVLNQTKHMIEQKIDFLVNEMCYPISSLVAFPQCICYTVERAKLRLAMYTWLKDEGAPELALSTILSCSENAFVTRYIKNHPGGLEVWENLKKQDSV
ncbi:Transcription termination factor mtef18 protein [Thalictrum thalictroides]|uniref:Transcription termination factor mtef18 protein n=1 Tax=Thalictrum thalictroides TaxID=46969 RepID=A0A7J6VW92_THATH|nr:Transcription termination factor mtef18 protein [Thalictrum thalictroides]